MGEKKSKNGGEKNNTKNEDGGSKEVAIILKVDLHCEGCASKVVKSIRSLEGVGKVKYDLQANKLTVEGEVDPDEVQEIVEQKLKRKGKMESLSQSKAKKDKPKENDNQVKTEKANGGEKKNNTSDNKNGKKNKDTNKAQKPKDKTDEGKSAELPVTTELMKMHLHCEGCIEKIYRIVSKTKGYHEMKFDPSKDQFAVTGSMDMIALAETLKKQMKRDVVIVPAKKDGGGGKKEKGGGGGEQSKGGGGGNAAREDGGNQLGQRMDFLPIGFPLSNQHPFPNPLGYPNPQTFQTPQAYPNLQAFQTPQAYPNSFPYPYVPGPSYPMAHLHAPQIFSDENPNACSIM